MGTGTRNGSRVGTGISRSGRNRQENRYGGSGMTTDIDVLVLGGAGVDTIVHVPELPLPFADSHMIRPGIVTRAWPPRRLPPRVVPPRPARPRGSGRLPCPRAPLAPPPPPPPPTPPAAGAPRPPPAARAPTATPAPDARRWLDLYCSPWPPAF